MCFFIKKEHFMKFSLRYIYRFENIYISETKFQLFSSKSARIKRELGNLIQRIRSGFNKKTSEITKRIPLARLKKSPSQSKTVDKKRAQYTQVQRGRSPEKLRLN